MQSELVIVGGGLVGLSLAIACAGAGLEVAVIDREAPDRMVDAAFDGRTSAIAFGSQRILAGIEILSTNDLARSAFRFMNLAVANAARRRNAGATGDRTAPRRLDLHRQRDSAG